MPHLARWEDEGEVPRALHRKAAAAGLLGIGFPEAVGGSGGDAIDSAIVAETLIRTGASSGLLAALLTHGIALPHIVGAGDPALIDRYVRPTLAGERIGALGVTEPGGGSDVAALRTTARRVGDQFVVNGTKTYITSGWRADFVTVLARTGGPGHSGLSLLVIDKATPGFTVTGRLDKLGWHCSDTAELSFVDAAVPATNLVGAEGSGFRQVASHFVGERLALAVQAFATAARCVELAVEWCRSREAFGGPLIEKQAVRHRLVRMSEQTEVAGAYVRAAVEASVRGECPPAAAAMAKNAAVAACSEVVDAAVQLHGGAGYMRGTEVERHYRDARVLGIGGGATEVMNDLIARGLGW